MTALNELLAFLDCLLAGIVIGLTLARSWLRPADRSDASLLRTLDVFVRAMDAANRSLAEQVALLLEQNVLLDDDDDDDDDDEADWWKREGDESPAPTGHASDPGSAS